MRSVKVSLVEGVKLYGRFFHLKANVHVALREAEKAEMKGKSVVTVIVDRGDRYLSKEEYTT